MGANGDTSHHQYFLDWIEISRIIPANQLAAGTDTKSYQKLDCQAEHGLYYFTFLLSCLLKFYFLLSLGPASTAYQPIELFSSCFKFGRPS